MIHQSHACEEGASLMPSLTEAEASRSAWAVRVLRLVVVAAVAAAIACVVVSVGWAARSELDAATSATGTPGAESPESVPDFAFISRATLKAPPSNIHAGGGYCGPYEEDVLYSTDLDAPAVGVADVQTCCARCQAMPLCIAWEWVPDTGDCHLKGGGFGGRSNWMSSWTRKQEKHRLPYTIVSGNATGRVPGKSVNPNHFRYQAIHLGGNAPVPACPGAGVQPVQIAGPAPLAGVDLRILSFNLEWWSNFDKGFPGEFRPYKLTNGNAATWLLQRNLPFDVMAFQECVDVQWILHTAGLDQEYEGRQGPEEVCIVWRKTAWELQSDGWRYASEDALGNYYRRRGVQWVRVQHLQSKRTLLFLNHHGPLPINSGGICGGVGTAINLLSTVQEQVQPGDAVVLVGDFNADQTSATVKLLSQYLTRSFTGTAFGGVDNFFTNLGAAKGTANLGAGGSDHQALEVLLSM